MVIGKEYYALLNRVIECQKDVIALVKKGTKEIDPDNATPIELVFMHLAFTLRDDLAYVLKNQERVMDSHIESDKLKLN